MNGSFRLALLVAACVLALGAAPAHAATKLRAQIAQATPTPTPTPMSGSELSEEPPGLDEEAPSGGGSDSEPDTGAGSGSDLPNTGADALLVALMGLGLIGTGLGLRRRLAHGGLRV